MRRFGRYAFHAITLLLLVLCLATAILGVRDRHTVEAVAYRWRHSQIYAGVCAGRALLGHNQDMENADQDLGFDWWSESRPQQFPADGWDDEVADYQAYAWRGFSYEGNSSGPHPYWGVTVPAWFAVLALSLLPALWVRSHGHRRTDVRRKANGCCRTCGYDLRATPNRCPECGMATEVALGAVE